MARSRNDFWVSTAAEALAAHLRVDELRKLAALLSTSKPTRKAELVALVLSHLEGDRLRSLWERLNGLQQAAVAEVVHGPDTSFRPEAFRAKYGGDPEWGSLAWGRLKDPSLLQLFFCGSRVMPDDLKERLQAFVPEPRRASLEALDELPATELRLAVRETERAAQHDLHAVLRLVEAGKVGVSDKTRRPGAAAAKAVAAALADGDFYDEAGVGPIKAFAWPLLVQAAGLAERAGSRLRLTKAGRTALGGPAAATLRTVWRRWLGTPLFDELSRIEAIKGQTGKGKRGLTAAADRRDAIDDALAECPVGRWVAADELFRYMRAAGHDFEVTRNAWGLYVCEPQYGSLGYDGYGGWNILQARYALCLLFEYAATLGLVDVAYVPPAGARSDFRELWGTDGLEFLSRYDGLAFVRLTPLGAYCLGVADEHAPAPLEIRPALRVLASLEVAATGEPLDFADRLALDRYAERVSDRVWRLAPGKLLAALEQGGSVAELREFLSARSIDALPGNVEALLEDVAARDGRLRDCGPARLVECAEPALAALVVNHSRTRKLCRPAGDRHLVVPTASERAFRRALRELGYVVSTWELGRAQRSVSHAAAEA